MIVGVYLENYPEPAYRTIPLNQLTQGRTIKDALKRLGITENRFVSGIITVIDRDTGIQMTFQYKEFDEFVNALWRVRSKLKKLKK